MKVNKTFGIILLCLGGILFILASIVSKTNNVHGTIMYFTSDVLLIVGITRNGLRKNNNLK